MDVDDVWKTTDRERAALADLLDELSPAEWEHPSLCAGWRVRDVAAHLSLAHAGRLEALVMLTRARFGFNRMIKDSAIRRAEAPYAEFAPAIRAMIGSRKKAPGISDVEPLTDVLVHTQDIVIPLGRTHAMPLDAAARAATRVWSMGFPFRARKRFDGVHLVATDTDWEAGSGAEVRGPIAAILLSLTGRRAGADRLTPAGDQARP